jgi:ubiquitin
VDATQIDGRAFRLNPEDPDWGDPGNPNKTTTIINLIDANTHELYKDRPQMLPIHCAEVIEGAEFRRPMKRPAALRQFSKAPPDLAHTLEEAGFALETDIERVREVSRLHKERRQHGVLEVKDEHWLSQKDTTRLPGGTRKAVQAAVKAILDVYDEEALGEQQVRHNGQSIRAQKMRVEMGSVRPICIYRDDWPKVELAAGVGSAVELPIKDDDWLSEPATRKLPGGSRDAIQTAVKAIIGAYDSERLGEQRIPYNDQSIRAQKMQSASAQPICICRDDWPKVELAAGVGHGATLPEKDDKWLSDTDTKTKLPGGGRSMVKAAVKAIIEAYDSQRLGIQRIPYNGHSIRVQKMQAASTQPICICRDDWPKVEQAAGVGPVVELPVKDDQWLSKKDTRELPGGQREQIEAAVKAIIGAYDSERPGEQRIPYNGQSIRVQKMQAGHTQPICVRRDDWPKVEQAAGVGRGAKLPQKDDKWLAPAADIARIPGGNRAPVQAAVKAILEAYDSDALGEQRIPYKSQSIRVQKMQSCTTHPICIYRDDWPKVELAAGVGPAVEVPVKDDKWLSQTDTRALPGGNSVAVEAAVKAIIGAYDSLRLGEQRIRHNGQSIRAQKMQSGVMQPICIYRDDWPKVEQAAEVEYRHAHERLTSSRPQPQQSHAHMTPEERAARKQPPPSRG